MNKKIVLALVLAGLSTVGLAQNFATPKSFVQKFPALQGGLRIKDITKCTAELNQQCVAQKQNPQMFQQCANSKMPSMPECAQNQALYQAVFFTGLNKARKYDNIVVVRGNVIMADASERFFIVSPTGDVVSLAGNLPIMQAIGDQAFQSAHPKATLFNETKDFPRAQKNNSGLRLIFTQPIKDGCKACAILGEASVAYDFAKDGQLQDITVIGFKRN